VLIEAPSTPNLFCLPDISQCEKCGRTYIFGTHSAILCSGPSSPDIYYGEPPRDETTCPEPDRTYRKMKKRKPRSKTGISESQSILTTHAFIFCAEIPKNRESPEVARRSNSRLKSLRSYTKLENNSSEESTDVCVVKRDPYLLRVRHPRKRFAS